MIHNPLRDSLPKRLLNGNSFNENDLYENRLGYLSTFQKCRLNILTLIYIFISCICFITSIIFFWLYIKWLFTEFTNVLSSSACLLWTIGLVLLGVIWMKNAIPLLGDSRDGKVYKAVGIVHKLSTPIPFSTSGPRVYNARMSYVRYRISGIVFSNIWVASEALPDGKKCQVYYAPASKIIVGVEPIGEKNHSLED